MMVLNAKNLMRFVCTIALGVLAQTSNAFAGNCTTPTTLQQGPDDSYGYFTWSSDAAGARWYGWAQDGNISEWPNIQMKITGSTCNSGQQPIYQVEAAPVGTAFKCTNTSREDASCFQDATIQWMQYTPSQQVSVGGTASIIFGSYHPLISGGWHWQARACSAAASLLASDCSNWVSFGGNAETAIDFKLDRTDPDTAPGTVADDGSASGSMNLYYSFTAGGDSESGIADYRVTVYTGSACNTYVTNFSTSGATSGYYTASSANTYSFKATAYNNSYTAGYYNDGATEGGCSNGITITKPTVSASTANGTYKAGDTITIVVTFAQAMTSSGSVVLGLETGTVDRNATCTNITNSTTMNCSYTVQAGDSTSDLDYKATTSLSGGSIATTARSYAAYTTLASPAAAGSLGANKAIVIDGIAPTVTGVTSSTANGTYKVGDTVSIKVNFIENVTVTGTPQLTLETGTSDAVVNYSSGSGTSSLTFNYTVASGHTSADLDYISTSALALNGGTIKDSAGNNATLTLVAPGAANSLGANKNLVIDGVAPTVTGVTSSTANATKKVGDTVSIQVGFSDTVTVTGTPQLTLETGTSDAVVNYASGSGTNSLTFTYTVASGHTSSDLDYTSTSALALNGGTIADASGNSAILTLATPGAANSLGANKALVIDGVVPTVSGVTSSTTNGTYSIGDAISIQVNFSEAVTVTGTPQLTLETGTSDAVVNYASGSGTSSLTFTYTVAGGESSSDLDYASTSALALNGGTIADAAGNNATLTLATPGAANSLGANKALVIDGVAATVTSVTSSTANGTYKIGDIISIQVTFSKSVTVTGTPQLTLETGTSDAVVDYASGSGSVTLTFTYTVQAGDVSADLDYASTSALALNSGTIRSAGSLDATLTLPTVGGGSSLGGQKSIVIDGDAPTVAITSPAASSYINSSNKASFAISGTCSENTQTVTVKNGSTTIGTPTCTAGAWTLNANFSNATTYPDASPFTVTADHTDAAGNSASQATRDFIKDTTVPTVSSVSSTKTNGTYGTGTTIAITVTFSENITVTGTPQISTLVTGGSGDTVDYTSGSGSTVLTFTYTVGSGDSSSDLDYSSTSALILNGGTLKDAAGNDATRTLATPGAAGSLGANKNIVIDTTSPTVTNVTSPASNGSYKVGDAIAIYVTFSKTVSVSGTPQLTLETGTSDAVVNYITGSGTSTLTFTYNISSGDTSSDLNYVSTSSLALNGGTIRDAYGNDATLTLPSLNGAGSLGTNKNLVIDTTAPTLTSIVINDSDAYAKSTGITIDVTASGSPTEMYFSNIDGGGGCPDESDGGSWITFDATDASFTLSGGDGSKTVYARVKDAAGNTSTCVSDSITLDTSVTTAADTILINGSSGANVSDFDGAVTVDWNLGNDSNSIGGYRVYTFANFSDCGTGASGTAQGVGEVSDATTTQVINPGNGTFYVGVRTRDAADNEAWTCFGNFTLSVVAETTPPLAFTVDALTHSVDCDFSTEDTNTSLNPDTTQLRSPDITWDQTTDADSGVNYYRVLIQSGTSYVDTGSDSDPDNDASAYDSNTSNENVLDSACASAKCTLTGYGSLTDGTYTAKVFAYDGAGNMRPSTNTITFKVDSTAPLWPGVGVESLTIVDGDTVSIGLNKDGSDANTFFYRVYYANSSVDQVGNGGNGDGIVDQSEVVFAWDTCNSLPGSYVDFANNSNSSELYDLHYTNEPEYIVIVAQDTIGNAAVATPVIRLEAWDDTDLLGVYNSDDATPIPAVISSATDPTVESSMTVKWNTIPNMTAASDGYFLLYMSNQAGVQTFDNDASSTDFLTDPECEEKTSGTVAFPCIFRIPPNHANINIDVGTGTTTFRIPPGYFEHSEATQYYFVLKPAPSADNLATYNIHDNDRELSFASRNEAPRMSNGSANDVTLPMVLTVHGTPIDHGGGVSELGVLQIPFYVIDANGANDTMDVDPTTVEIKYYYNGTLVNWKPLADSSISVADTEVLCWDTGSGLYDHCASNGKAGVSSISSLTTDKRAINIKITNQDIGALDATQYSNIQIRFKITDNTTKVDNTTLKLSPRAVTPTLFTATITTTSTKKNMSARLSGATGFGCGMIYRAGSSNDEPPPPPWGTLLVMALPALFVFARNRGRSSFEAA